MRVDLNRLALFAKVAQMGSFSAAALALGFPKSTVSAAVAALEDSLGVRLLVRNTRRLSLTEEGRRIFEHAAGLSGLGEEVAELASSAAEEPSGLLRITTPVTFGNTFVAPIMARFLADFPKVEAELEMTDRNIDIVAEGFDLAIRIGEVEEQGWVQRSLGRSPHRLCASPFYLRQHGLPSHPRELTAHACLPHGSRQIWQLTGPGGEVVDVRPSGRLRASALLVLKEASLAGLGIVRLPDHLCLNELADGRLAEIMPEWRLASPPVTALIPTRSGMPARIRLFLDRIVRDLARQPWLNAAAAPAP